MAEQGIDLVLTSGGLGPTADDLTAEVVGRFQGREMVLDERARASGSPRSCDRCETLAEHRPGGDSRGQPQAGDDPRRRHGARAGGHRAGPGRGAAAARRRADRGRAAGAAARAAADVERPRSTPTRCARRSSGATVYRAAHAAPVRDPRVGDRRDAAGGRARGRRAGIAGGDDLPETRRGRGRDALRARRARRPTRRFAALVASATPRRCSPRTAAPSIEQVARAAARRRVAHAADDRDRRVVHRRPAGGAADRAARAPRTTCRAAIVAYSNEAKIALAGVAAELIEGHGAVSAEVARGAGRRRARSRLGADVGVGVTGVAGPGGGTAEKPVGLVWLSVAGARIGAGADALGQSARGQARTSATARPPSRCT